VQGGSAHVQFVLRCASDARLDYAVKAFMLFAFNASSWLVARRIPLLEVDYTAEQTNTETSRVYQPAPARRRPRLPADQDELRRDAAICARIIKDANIRVAQ
jgi:hypothetical protein